MDCSPFTTAAVFLVLDPMPFLVYEADICVNCFSFVSVASASKVTKKWRACSGGLTRQERKSQVQYQVSRVSGSFGFDNLTEMVHTFFEPLWVTHSISCTHRIGIFECFLWVGRYIHFRKDIWMWWSEAVWFKTQCLNFTYLTRDTMPGNVVQLGTFQLPAQVSCYLLT